MNTGNKSGLTAKATYKVEKWKEEELAGHFPRSEDDESIG